MDNTRGLVDQSGVSTTTHGHMDVELAKHRNKENSHWDTYWRHQFWKPILYSTELVRLVILTHHLIEIIQDYNLHRWAHVQWIHAYFTIAFRFYIWLTVARIKLKNLNLIKNDCISEQLSSAHPWVDIGLFKSMTPIVSWKWGFFLRIPC